MKKIKTVLDRFEDEKAVLRVDGEDIILPKKYLDDKKEGEVIHILISGDKEDTENSRVVAEELLKQVFKE